MNGWREALADDPLDTRALRGIVLLLRWVLAAAPPEYKGTRLLRALVADLSDELRWECRTPSHEDDRRKAEEFLWEDECLYDHGGRVAVNYGLAAAAAAASSRFVEAAESAVTAVSAAAEWRLLKELETPRKARYQ